jgi:hypothetical protein
MPSKVPEGKVQINILISEEIYKLLIEIAPQIHGKYRGALSRVIEDALRLYLTQRAPQGGESPPRHTHMHTKTHKSVHEIFLEVLNYIKKLHDYSESDIICEITERDLIKAIHGTRGIDPRTVEKYLKAFQEHNLIKYESGNTPNMIFRVMIYPECRKVQEATH